MNTQAVMSASALRAPPIFMLGMLAALGLFATNIYLPSLPAIADALGTTTSGAQTTVTVFMFTFAVAQLLFGPITDRYGRRPVLIVGLFIYSAASIAAMLATDIESLIVARCLQAIGACSAAVISRAIVRDVFRRARDLPRVGGCLGVHGHCSRTHARRTSGVIGVRKWSMRVTGSPSI